MNIGGFAVIVVALLAQRSHCLDCFVCHSRQNPDCGDPFSQNNANNDDGCVGNASGTLVLYECDRVRKVGESVVAASNAMGGSPPMYTPLERSSYVCYKITMGQHAVRGCAKPDFCANMTEVCEVCNADGCNAATDGPRLVNVILVIAYLVLNCSPGLP